MPEKVRRDLGFALRLVQRGEFPEIAKPLQGKAFKGVYELRVRDQGNAYRAAYIANLGDHIYVLHAFQKKSSQAMATPKPHLDTIQRRLHDARKQVQDES
jgi:phage-related protein